MSLQDTPRANRLHITFFGRRNSGKSSLINALCGQEVSLVSEYAGTTTDPVEKAIELHPIGPCLLIDTAGFDDTGALGTLRVEKTEKTLDKTDVALLLLGDSDMAAELAWARRLKERGIPFLAVVSRADAYDARPLAGQIQKLLDTEPVIVSAKTGENLDQLLLRLVRMLPEDFEAPSITGHLVQPDDTVLLVMPQDIQAPKGRLILPQVQTIRDLLERHCTVVCCTTDRLDTALGALSAPPALIVTDSQVFDVVYRNKPPQSRLTSFSVLFAQYKGDIEAYLAGAKVLAALRETDRVLIAEACSHKPLDGDIGRVKLPKMLRQKIGQNLHIDVVSGADFPADLTPYRLVIHCGGCMFNRRYILSRIARAKEQGVAVTNYGVAIAALQGILDKITI